MADFLQPNRGFIYVNGSTIGKLAPTSNDVEMRNFPECEVKFKFPDALIRKANDYSVALVRFEVPTQLLAKTPEFPGAIEVMDPAGNPFTFPDGSEATLHLPSCFTLYQVQEHILDFCNNFWSKDA